MQLCTFASSSRGNCALIRSGGTAVLVDAGISCRKIRQRLGALELTPDSRFELVVRAKSLNGIERQIAGGEAGMEQFRRRQRRQKLRRFAGLLVRPFKPLKFLRLPANKETKYRDGTVQWSFAGIPVAARTPSGEIRYLHWSKRLFFRIPAQKKRGQKHV